MEKGKGVLIGLAVEALRNFFSKWRKRKLIVSPNLVVSIPHFFLQKSKKHMHLNLFFTVHLLHLNVAMEAFDAHGLRGQVIILNSQYFLEIYGKLCFQI